MSTTLSAVDTWWVDMPNGGRLLRCLSVGLFVVTISQAAQSQRRPDTTVPSAMGGGHVQVVVDTSVYGASKVSWSVGMSVGVIDSGVISGPEVTYETNAIYLGSSIPTREVSFSSAIALRHWNVSALVDYRGGFKQANGTEDARCKLELCGALYDPGASLDDQGQAVAVRYSGAGFVEDASFVRLREIAVTWKPVPGWAHHRGLARFDLTIAARSLLTFSGYSGLDPEVNYTGQSGLSRGELNTLPLSRTMIIRFDIQR